MKASTVTMKLRYVAAHARSSGRNPSPWGEGRVRGNGPSKDVTKLNCHRTRCSIVVALLLSAAITRADSWPMFHGGPALLGVASGDLPVKPELLWSFKTGRPVKSSAAIDGG